MPSKSELEKVWADAYKKALSRGRKPKVAREMADRAAADASVHGGEGPLRPRASKRVEKILQERINRAAKAEEAQANAPEDFISPTERKRLLIERNKAFVRNWASRLRNVSPMTRLQLHNNYLKVLNSKVDAAARAQMNPPQVPFERYLSHQEISNQVAEKVAERLAGPTQWKNWTQAQRQEAIEETRYWDQFARDTKSNVDEEYMLREVSVEAEKARRLGEEATARTADRVRRYSMVEKGMGGVGEYGPIERTPYTTAKQLDREIFSESIKWTGAKIGAAGAATGAAVKGGAKTAARWGGRALARLGSGAVAGPAGMIAMGALTGWDVGNMIYDTANNNLDQMKGAQWPGIQAGVASIAALGNMLANRITEEPIEPYMGDLEQKEEEQHVAEDADTPVGFGPISDWNDMVDTVLGNITGQGIEGEPDPQTANEIVETWAKAYEGELKKEEKDTGVESASPGDWFGSAGWDWANQAAQDKPAEAIADAFDPWTQFNPRDQSSLEAHGADIGRGLGGSADEELKELMAQTSFLQKIAENTKEDEIAVLGT